MTDLTLRAEHVVTPDGVLHDGLVRVVDGVIADVGPAPAGHAAPGAESLAGWLLPGFVDTHVHGGGGADLATTGPDEARQAVAFHARHGTTTTFASLVTATPDRLAAQLRTLAPLVAEQTVAGVHLEGPFLSAAKCGAHDPALLRPPQPAEVDRVLADADGLLAMITIAPELDGALGAIERFRDTGVAVALGHTDADREQAVRGIDAGGRVATHLFNAMRPVHHREPGPVPMLLTRPEVCVELIADGVHLHPDVLALAVRAAGPSRVALVTDAMAAAGMADGDYRIGELAVTVQSGVARLLRPDGGAGSIAGSTLTMDVAVRHLLALGFGHVEVARMASTTPARWHGLPRVGAITADRYADLALLDDAGTLVRVMQRGRWRDDAAGAGSASPGNAA